METFPVAMLIARNAVHREVNGARPEGPAVPPVPPAPRRPRAFRTRTTLAGVPQRAATVVAPRECSPAC